MAYLTDSGKKLLKEALFRLNLDDSEWSIPDVIGAIIGQRISLLGCTNNRQSLNPVFVTIQRVISEINELRTFRTEQAVRAARDIVVDRYTHFFEGMHRGDRGYDALEIGMNSLTQKNSGEVVREVLEVIAKVLDGSGIMTIIHNQESNTEANQPAPSTPPASSDEQPVSA